MNKIKLKKFYRFVISARALITKVSLGRSPFTPSVYSPSPSKFYIWHFYLCLIVGIGGCGFSKSPDSQPSPQPSKQVQPGQLVVSDITLEQADEKGQLWWKVKAKGANYTKDQKIAYVQNPDGELFQDGKLVFQIQAMRGEIQQDGDKIFLSEDIIATDTQNGAVLRGDELEWRPKEDILIVRKNVTGTHKQLDASASEGRMFTRARRMELIGKVVATTKEPVLQLRTEHLIWEIDKEMAIAPKPIAIDRYKDKKIIDTAVSDLGEVNLKTKIATLQKNAFVKLLQPPLQIASDSISWNVAAETVTSDQPVKVMHYQDQLIFGAKQGMVDIKQKICYMTGDVQGFEQRRQSQLRADRLTWYLTTQDIEAQGNVVYRQIDPPFTVSGPQAVGKLNDQTVTVKGGGGPVVTEIIPQKGW